MKGKFVQFELWKDCNNNCSFCFNQKQQDINKLDSIKFVIQSLAKIDYKIINQIGLIGGEFFDDQLNDSKVHDLFYILISNICQKIRTRQIQKLYITTSLIYKNTSLLEEFIKYIITNNCQNNILICTSYDVIGRFHTSERYDIWKSNMQLLNEKYSSIKKHIEIILTQAFIESVQNGKLNIEKMMVEYNSQIDYLEPFVPVSFESKEQFCRLMPKFLPNRKDFIDFVMRYCILNKVIDLQTLFSKKIRSDTLYYIKNQEHYCISDRHNNCNTCGLEQNGRLPIFGYADSDIQMCDDVKRLYDTF